MSEVRLVFLKTGEQIVGDTTYSESLDSFEIKHPLMVVQTGQEKLGFMDYLQLADTDVVIFQGADVRHTFEPKQDIVNYWNQLFGAGLVVPGKQAGGATILTG